MKETKLTWPEVLTEGSLALPLAAGAFLFLALASFIAEAGSDTEDASREPLPNSVPGAGGGIPMSPAAKRCPLKLDSRAARSAKPGSPQNLSRQSPAPSSAGAPPSTPKSSIGDEFSRLEM
jgi:hypothetical protein